MRVLNLLQGVIPRLEDLLSAELMADIAAYGRRVTYRDGALIAQRGDASTGFSIVESGQAIAGSEGRDGSYLTAALLSPGDHFGDHTLFAGLPRLQNLRAIGDTRILHVPADQFFRLFNAEPDLGRALLTIALRRIHVMMEFMDGQRRLRLPVRVAHLLLTSVKDTQRGRHAINCRQEDLGQMLGVSRVAVSKALKSLEAEGMITRRYGSIEVNDVPGMRRWLQDTFQVVPLQVDADWRF